MVKKTVLHGRHVEAGGRLVDFGGWELPVQYEGILAEHRHCREGAALFDCSHMGQFYITGPEAGAALGRVCTQDAENLKVGRCKYGYLLNESGGVIDDTILMRLGEESYHLVVNASTQDGDFAWMCEKMSGDFELVNLSGDAGWSKVDLQGPESLDVLAPLVDGDLTEWKYFGVKACVVDGREVVLSRTGYTGELGYEVMGSAEDVLAIFDRIICDERVKPAGLGARDSLRLEMTYPLYGHEMDVETTPLESDGGFFLDLDRAFIGVEALRKQKEEGLGRILVAYSAETRRRTSPGDEIWADGKKVGVVTSGAFSPSLEKSVGMGFVEPEFMGAGTGLTVRTARADIDVIVETKPLYREGTCRRKL